MKRRLLKLVFTSGLLYAAASHTGATEQNQEIIIVEGAVCSFPGIALGDALPAQKIPRFRMTNRFKKNGYTATWAIMDGHLFLIGIEGLLATADEGRRQMHSSSEIFPNVVFPHKLTGFSGTIQVWSSVPSSLLGPDSDPPRSGSATITIRHGQVISMDGRPVRRDPQAIDRPEGPANKPSEATADATPQR